MKFAFWILFRTSPDFIYFCPQRVVQAVMMKSSCFPKTSPDIILPVYVSIPLAWDVVEADVSFRASDAREKILD